MTLVPRPALRFALVLSACLIGALVVDHARTDVERDAIQPLPKHPKAGETYLLEGQVIGGPVRRAVSEFDFTVQNSALVAAVRVRYSGPVPDPFRIGRLVSVDVRTTSTGVVTGESGSLTTNPRPLRALAAS